MIPQYKEDLDECETIVKSATLESKGNAAVVHEDDTTGLRTGGHLDMSCNAQETCLYRMNSFSKALISPKCHLLCQDAPCP